MKPNQVTDMANERFESVWDAIEDTPEEALNMRLRSELMIQITRRVKEWGVTQKEAAQRLGITQPRLNDLLNGRINKFGLDALVNLTGPAHFHVELTLKDEEAAVA
jgi:predicted XRE-type DNA-binding protein